MRPRADAIRRARAISGAPWSLARRLRRGSGRGSASSRAIFFGAANPAASLVAWPTSGRRAARSDRSRSALEAFARHRLHRIAPDLADAAGESHRESPISTKPRAAEARTTRGPSCRSRPRAARRGARAAHGEVARAADHVVERQAGRATRTSAGSARRRRSIRRADPRLVGREARRAEVAALERVEDRVRPRRSRRAPQSVTPAEKIGSTNIDASPTSAKPFPANDSLMYEIPRSSAPASCGVRRPAARARADTRRARPRTPPRARQRSGPRGARRAPRRRSRCRPRGGITTRASRRVDRVRVGRGGATATCARRELRVVRDLVQRTDQGRRQPIRRASRQSRPVASITTSAAIARGGSPFGQRARPFTRSPDVQTSVRRPALAHVGHPCGARCRAAARRSARDRRDGV